MTRATPVTIRGKTYPSHKSAAKEIGVCVSAIAKAKARGTLDGVGLGRPAPKPVTIMGVAYPSMSAASRETGMQWRDISYLMGAK